MIYKPTDLSPSAQSFDCQKPPIFLECKLDTSNVIARGFTVKVYNSDNDLVFSSVPEGEPLDIKYISLIEDLDQSLGSLTNSGYNGSYLKIPFLVDAGDADTGSNNSTLWLSQVFYNESGSGSKIYHYVYDSEGNIDTNHPDLVNIYNGQSYKWAITIYQLEKQDGNWILPNNPLYYDMPLTTGTILGSNEIRIQSVKSDEIYSDYFVQPVYINGLEYDLDKPEEWSYVDLGEESQTIDETRVTRVLIKSYDPTYGYIYPVEGSDGFRQGAINPTNVNGFRIYKRGNNIQDLTVVQQVDYVCENPLDTSEDGYDYGEWSWSEDRANPGNSYWQQIYQVKNDPEGVYYIGGIGKEKGYGLQGGERIVLNNMQKGMARNLQGEYIGSPYNGIFYPQFSVNQLQMSSTASSYDNTKDYEYGDWVIYSSKVFECKGVVRNVYPTTSVPGNAKYWEEIDPLYDPQILKVASPYNSNLFYAKGAIVYAKDPFDPQDYNNHYFKCTGVVYGRTPLMGSQWKNYWEYIGSSSQPAELYQINVKWYRTPDANTWGDLISKTVLVTSLQSDSFGGQNIQIQDVNEGFNTYGMINQTPFKFIKEKPIEIYKNFYEKFDATKSYSKGDTVSFTKYFTYPDWVSNKHYIIGDIVHYGSAYYISKASVASETAPSEDTSNWETYEGHSPNQSYRAGDIVYGNNGYYICIQNAPIDTAITNTNFWVPYMVQSYYSWDSSSDSSTEPINHYGVLSQNWIEHKYYGNTGLIFYNNALDSDSSSDANLYIRHFEGLQDGMVLFKNTNTNIQDYIQIKHWNPIYNFIEYDKVYSYDSYKEYNTSSIDANPIILSSDITWTPADSQGNGTKYQIKTFFRESDETAFNFYSDGSIENLSVVQDGMGNVTVSAEYSQIQYIQWKSAQWFLYNINNALIATSDIIYDKELKWTFYGLNNGNYTVKLVIENYVGATQENSSSFEISSGYEQASGDLAVSFNCESMTVDTSVITDVVDLSIYKREVWYTFTGQFEDSSVWGKKIPVVEGHAEDIWHLVHQGDGIALGPNSIINDFNIANSRYYEYKYLYKKRNTNTVYTSTLALKTKWDGWTLTELHPVDGEGKQYTASLSDVWKFKYNISPGDTTQNFSKNAQDTLASFPKFVQGPKNNLTGSVTCLLGRDVKPFDWIDIDYSYSNGTWNPGFASRGYNAGGYQEQLWPEVSYDDLTSNRSVDMLNRFRNFCFSGNPKLLKDNKGRSFIVEVHDTTYHIEEAWSGRPVTISLNWTEIKNADDIEIVGQSAYYTPGMSYSLYNGGKFYALTGRGESEDIDIFIPNTINNKPVTKIDFGAFEYDDDLEFVVTPDNMQIISSKAFSQCTSLRGVNFTNKGKNISYIGEGAFSGCTSLSSISIPTGVTIINTKVFENCTALEEVKLNNVESIGTSAFAGCSSLSSIKLPDSLTILKTKAFERCSDLRRVEYGNSPSLYCIEEGVFSRCNNLSSIYIPSSVSIMSSKVFSHCKSLESVTFGDNISLNKISNGVFNYCEKLPSIIIPDTVTEIGGNAFRHCDKLVSITIPSNVSSIGSYAFGFCPKLQISSLPNNITSISQGLFYDCREISSFTIGANVNIIQPYAFVGCNNLTAVIFENTSGWFITNDPSATTGTSITVTNTETNAENLVTTYNEYYWKRSI